MCNESIHFWLESHCYITYTAICCLHCRAPPSFSIPQAPFWPLPDLSVASSLPDLYFDVHLKQDNKSASKLDGHASQSADVTAAKSQDNVTLRFLPSLKMNDFCRIAVFAIQLVCFEPEPYTQSVHPRLIHGWQGGWNQGRVLCTFSEGSTGSPPLFTIQKCYIFKKRRIIIYYCKDKISHIFIWKKCLLSHYLPPNDVTHWWLSLWPTDKSLCICSIKTRVSLATFSENSLAL